MSIAILLTLAGIVLALILFLGADLAITANSVLKGIGASTQTVTAGVAVTAGEPVYIDTTPLSATLGQALLCKSDSAADATIAGITLGPAGAGQPVVILTGGLITIGATVVKGETYVISAVAGKICPTGDLTTGCLVTQLGVAPNTTQILCNFNITNVVHA